MRTRALLADQDERVAAFGRSLTDEDWAQPSLCEEWTNLDVLAHLVVGYEIGAIRFSRAFARARGSFDRANAAVAIDHAESPAALLDRFDVLRRGRKGVGRLLPNRFLLSDHVLHLLDIAFPLGREVAIDNDALRCVLDTQVRIPNPFLPSKRMVKGLSLATTDLDWSRPADGPSVRGRAIHLASVLGGRLFATHQLDGDGVESLRSRWARRR